MRMEVVSGPFLEPLEVHMSLTAQLKITVPLVPYLYEKIEYHPYNEQDKCQNNFTDLQDSNIHKFLTKSGTIFHTLGKSFPLVPLVRPLEIGRRQTKGKTLPCSHCCSCYFH